MAAPKLIGFPKLLWILAALPHLLHAQTQVTLTATPNPSAFGAAVALTAQVPFNSTGRIAFLDGVTILGTSPIVSGTASLSTAQLPAGVRKLTAFYSGDGNFPAATSNVVTQTVLATAGLGFVAQAPLSVAPAAPAMLAVGDFNGDGKADFAIPGGQAGPGNVTIGLGNGDGTFQTPITYPTGAGPYAVALGDFNGDGKTDLAITNNVGANVSILLGNGDGTFRAAVNYPAGNSPGAIVTGDFNRDGIVDLAIANILNPGTVSVLIGNGDGTFRSLVSYPVTNLPGSIVAADFDGDGKADLAVGSLFDDRVQILLGNGDGSFQPLVNFEVAPGNLTSTLLAGDFNGDGKADLATSNGTTTWILLGVAGGAFLPPVSYPGGSPAAGDFNGDGIPDLAVFNSVGNVTILLGSNGGAFQSLLTFPTTNPPATMAVADFNGDSRADIAVTSLTGGLTNGGSVSILLGVTSGLSITATGGARQSAMTGAPFTVPLQVTILNHGVPVSGAIVSFTAPANGASAFLAAAAAVTNSSGIASITATANGIPGSYVVSAVYQGAFAAFNLTNTGPPASITATGGSGQIAGVGTAFTNPLQATVRDSAGNLVGGVTVTFTAPVTGASAVLSSVSAMTNASGVASVTATANNIAGNYNVTASVGTSSATFSLTNVAIGGGSNLAMGKVATQSSTLLGFATSGASRAVDGNTDGNFFNGSVTHTNSDTNAWWQVDLGVSAIVNSVKIWNRTDCCGDRLGDYWVFVSDIPFGPSDTPATLQNRPGTFTSHQTTAPNPSATIAVGGAQGRYVRVQLAGTNNLSLAEVQVVGTATSVGANLAMGKAASQSSTFPFAPSAGAFSAVDGNTDGSFFNGSVTHTNVDTNAWWQVDLGASALVNSVVIWNRTDCCGDRLSNYWVFISDTPFSPTDTPATLQNRPGTFSSHQTTMPSPSTTITAGGVQGRYVRVQLAEPNNLSLAEVQVIGVLAPVTPNLALGRSASQSSTLDGFPNATAGVAVDGNTDGNFFNGSVTHTNMDTNAWWQVDLGTSAAIGSVVIWNRTDCCGTRLNDYWVFVSDTPFSPTDTPATLQTRAGTFATHQTTAPNPSAMIAIGAQGRYVRVQLTGTNLLSLAEVQVLPQ